MYISCSVSLLSILVDSDDELDLMATQTFVTDLQAMNPTVVQVHQVNNNVSMHLSASAR